MRYSEILAALLGLILRDKATREGCPENGDAAMKETILSLWNQGNNTWVIAQRSGATENAVIDVVEEEQKRLAAAVPNDRVEGRDAALSRRVPSHDGLAGTEE